MKKIFFLISLLSSVIFSAQNLSPYLVKDIYPGFNMQNSTFNASQPSEFHKLGNSLFFLANDGIYGTELWKSDGTAAGTDILTDIVPGMGTQSMQKFCVAGSNLFFCREPDSPYLWRTDGTASGTILLKMIKIRGFENMTALGSTVYFMGDEPQFGNELWKSDGTVAGTVIVKDFVPGPTSGFPLSRKSNLTPFGNKLFFSAPFDAANTHEPWITDGTDAGTVMVKDIYTNISSFPQDFTQMGSYMYFMTKHPSVGVDLWRSDGTNSGTVLVKHLTDTYSIPTYTFSNIPPQMIVIGSNLYFQLDDGIHGFELWKSDGTIIGTTLVKDINPGSQGSGVEYSNYVVFGTDLYFSAQDGMHGNTYQLWKSDGTQTGTVIVSDSVSLSYRPRMCVSGSNLYFGGNSGDGYKLWATDGTSVRSFNLSFTDFLDFNGKLVFSGELFYGRELWAMGNCSISNPTVSGAAFYNQQTQTIPSTQNCYCDVYNKLIASIDAVGANPVSGDFISVNLIDDIQTPTYVKKYYYINPANNANTATGKVTLYFNQQDFDGFNAVAPTLLLPTSGTDNAGISNLKIYRTYQSFSEVINPDDTDIIWNVTLNRWEISFNTVGFGAFAVVTDGTPLLSQQEFESTPLTYFPNPTNGLFTVDSKETIQSIKMFTILGNEVLKQEPNQKHLELNLENLEAGVYFLMIKTEHKTQTIKVVKK